MTQRAADDYVAIKQALEQIEREKAAALDTNPEYDGPKMQPPGNDDMGGKSVDEYLGMLGWAHWSGDDWAKYRAFLRLKLAPESRLD